MPGWARRAHFVAVRARLTGALQTVALITDGRFSGASHGFCTGHVVPEAIDGGPIALVEDGDRIVIDAEKRTIDWLVDEEEQKRRREKWVPREYRAKRGVLYRYARDVAVSTLWICKRVGSLSEVY